MKHLKLFEAFREDDKITSVNNILIGYFLFNYLVDYDILVEKHYRSRDVVYRFWYVEVGGRYYNDFIGYLVGSSRVLVNLYTEENFRRAFLGYLNEQAIKDIFTFTDPAFTGHIALSIIRALKNYISYLENTPEKNHLLRE